MEESLNMVRNVSMTTVAAASSVGRHMPNMSVPVWHAVVMDRHFTDREEILARSSEAEPRTVNAPVVRSIRTVPANLE